MDSSRHIAGVAWQAAVAVALALTLSACLAPLTEPLPEKHELRQFHAVPKERPDVASDGQSYITRHFELRYSPGVEEDPRFASLDDRTSFGLGKLLQIQALYEFLHEVFGFTLETRALIVIDKELASIYGARPAGYVSSRDAAYGGRTVVHLSVDTISDSGTLGHELTHALDMLCIGTSAPAWFAEGLAQMVENELVDASDVRDPTPIGSDASGRNLLQLWSGHRRTGAGLPAAVREKAYNHSYYILATLRDRYGDVFYRRLFDLMRPHDRVSDAQLVALMSEAAGESLEGFFTDELHFQLAEQQAVDGFAPYLTGLGQVTDGSSTVWVFAAGGSAQRHTFQDAQGTERVVDGGLYTLTPDAAAPGVFSARVQLRRRVRVRYDATTANWDQLEEAEQNTAIAVTLQRDENGLLIDGVLYRPLNQR